MLIVVNPHKSGETPITAASSYLMNKIMYTIDSFKHDKKSSLDVIKDGEYQINPLKFFKIHEIN